MKMKAVLIALATAILAASAHSQPALNPQPAPQDRAQEYRTWAAEQMIIRLTEKIARSLKVCGQNEDWMPKLSEKCRASVLGSYPILATIREVAASGDVVRWTELVERVHTFEAGIEGPLNNLERK